MLYSTTIDNCINILWVLSIHVDLWSIPFSTLLPTNSFSNPIPPTGLGLHILASATNQRTSKKHSEVPAIAKPRGAEQRPFNQQLSGTGKMSKVSPNGNSLRRTPFQLWGYTWWFQSCFFVFECGAEEWNKLPLFQMGWGFTSWTLEILRWHAATSFQDLWKATIWF